MRYGEGHIIPMLANRLNRLEWELEILINEPNSARKRSISSRGTWVFKDMRQPLRGRLMLGHTCAVLKKLAVSVEEFCGVDFGGGVF